MSPEVVRRRAILTGHVQGVFFRASVKEAADDGGDAEVVESVLGYCRTGFETR